MGLLLKAKVLRRSYSGDSMIEIVFNVCLIRVYKDFKSHERTEKVTPLKL